MEQLRSLVEQAGGAVHKRDLVAHGATDRMLTAAVRSGAVHRARRGWYTTFPPGDPRHEAVRIGGRLTGASLLALSGAWLWDTPPVTVVVLGNASRLRARRGAIVVWRSEPTGSGRTGSGQTRPGRSRPTGRDDPPWADSLGAALRHAVLHLPFDEAVALLDWSLVSGSFTVADLRAVFADAPGRASSIVDWVDPRSESFLESITRATFTALGHRVELQVPVGRRDRRRIDVVVDDEAAVELDGREFHAGTFHADRMKDAAITVAGRTSLRCGYYMVRDERLVMVSAVHAILARSAAQSPGAGRCRRGRHDGCLTAPPWRNPTTRPPRAVAPRARRPASVAGTSR
ncbi:type IV toxin-antitoxin system AbiEi family antitoxin domain-containing protein [Frigoribacterium faeni]|uniref:DUF559 domain-containing protein n=1 Tax=Frigoribacterium faeni TaxID=145483 RepID=A0A7W3JIS3_9MICO|nr:type IV toxin-antitoxin system AbiEi family antitoxin domain-containing protein [Frigoribacterium faeni]MBA8813541.1 hypothetical protein [Frigoribacterium faeni]BFF14802.1 hypothetical protein GCM10025699_61050 [Microbacterium flavescens]GEK82741.1 hypothetical protein FFA01_10500 [Frigoribacterium faeni]